MPRPTSTRALCSSLHSLSHNIHKRYLSTQTDSPPFDWISHQVKRAEYRSLVDLFSEYGSTRSQKKPFTLKDIVRRPPAQATLSALLSSGAHFGHESSRMMPNFMPYAYGVRAGITIIDLDRTLPLLRRAAHVVRAVARAGGQILFIGTRPDLRPVIQKASDRLHGQGYYVGDRWLPGTFTNKIQMFGNEDLRNIKIVPDLVILLNPLANLNAIRECAVENVPTIGIIDSNADPRIVMYPIPANDESTRTAEIIAGVLSVAGREGVAIREESERERKRIEEGIDDDDTEDIVLDLDETETTSTDDGDDDHTFTLSPVFV